MKEWREVQIVGYEHICNNVSWHIWSSTFFIDFGHISHNDFIIDFELVNTRWED